MASMKRQPSDRPYELLARELTARIDAAGLTRSALQAKSGIDENILKHAFAGTRPIPDTNIPDLAQLLHREGENEAALEERLRQLNRPGASATHLLRGLQAPLRIGYLDSPPFASASRRGPTVPKGVLVQLLELLLQLLNVRCEWQPVHFNRLVDALETRQVDLISGFILESPSRRTRARFVPLDMPFAIGVNAISRSSHFRSPSPYMSLAETLTKSAHALGPQFNFITIRGEIADEYFPALFPSVEPTIRDTTRTVDEAIRHYTSAHPDKERNIVFADHMTCSRFATNGAKLLLDQPLGRFHGGFLLPVQDPEWGEYFAGSLRLLMRARLPQVGHIFVEHDRELAAFLETADRPLVAIPHAPPIPDRHQEFWTLEEWLTTYWPREIPIPPSFAAHLSPQGPRRAGTSNRSTGKKG